MRRAILTAWQLAIAQVTNIQAANEARAQQIRREAKTLSQREQRARKLAARAAAQEVAPARPNTPPPAGSRNSGAMTWTRKVT